MMVASFFSVSNCQLFCKTAQLQ